MQNFFLVLLGKILARTLRLLNLGSGSTWPGHIALFFNENFIEELLYKNKLKLVLIAGTNGKTTAASLVKHILEQAGYSVLQNKSGANLENGLASTLIEGANLNKKINFDYLIFESDENTLPTLLDKIEPDYLILLNLFRDQLDRYGELDSIIKKWLKGISKLSPRTSLILNSDDPQIYYFSESTSAKIYFFGLSSSGDGSLSHGADSIFCPRCNTKLNFSKVFYSHLGIWDCKKCGLKREKPSLSSSLFYPLEGLYNQYNTNASSLFAKLSNIPNTTLKKALKSFTPAFGRQEKISLNNKDVQIFLSKNPISFNESLSTIGTHSPKNLLIVLNDRVPDGLDISWIWDITIEASLDKKTKIFISGDRLWEMYLRLKYSSFQNLFPFENLNEAIQKAIASTKNDEILYVLPNYSAKLEIRNILLGRKIL